MNKLFELKWLESDNAGFEIIGDVSTPHWFILQTPRVYELRKLHVVSYPGNTFVVDLYTRYLSTSSIREAAPHRIASMAADGYTDYSAALLVPDQPIIFVNDEDDCKSETYLRILGGEGTYDVVLAGSYPTN